MPTEPNKPDRLNDIGGMLIHEAAHKIRESRQMAEAKGTGFVDDEELIGRTISAAHFGEHSFLFVFSDGTYTKMTFGGGWYPGEGEMMFDDDFHEDQKEWLKENGAKLP